MVDEINPAAIRARGEWRRLADRLATVTPAALGRAVLTAAVLLVVVQIVAATWPALAPFAVGALIAYTVLPLVDRLDAVMPRLLAAVVSVVAVVAVVVAIIAAIVGPLAVAVVALASDLPTAEDIDRIIRDLESGVGLPDGVAVALAPAIADLAEQVRTTLASASSSVGDLVIAAAQGIFNAAAAALGLLVLPTWIVTVLRDKGRARAVFDRRLAGWLRADAWAVVSIMDRAAGTYLRGYLLVAFLIGLAVWVTLLAIGQMGGPTFTQPLPIAVFAGASQAIPAVGVLLGFIPALLIAPLSAERALTYVVVYVAARYLVGGLVGSRLLEGRLGVHPAILVPGVVALSQFGLLWLLLSAPIIAIVTNLVRYFHGRLSDVPRPAGVLPGQPVPTPAPGATAAGTTAGARVPLAYRTKVVG